MHQITQYQVYWRLNHFHSSHSNLTQHSYRYAFLILQGGGSKFRSGEEAGEAEPPYFVTKIFTIDIVLSEKNGQNLKK